MFGVTPSSHTHTHSSLYLHQRCTRGAFTAALWGAHTRERERGGTRCCGSEHLHPAWFMFKVRRDILLSSVWERTVAWLFNPECTVIRGKASRFVDASLRKRMCSVYLIMTVWMWLENWFRVFWIWILEEWRVSILLINLSTRSRSRTSCIARRTRSRCVPSAVGYVRRAVAFWDLLV